MSGVLSTKLYPNNVVKVNVLYKVVGSVPCPPWADPCRTELGASVDDLESFLKVSSVLTWPADAIFEGFLNLL